MAEVDDTPLEPGDISSDNRAVAEALDELSWVEGLRKERDERAQVDSLKLGIPTWGPSDEPDLAAEFGVIDPDELTEFMRQARKRARQQQGRGGSEEGNESDAAFLAKACQAMWARNPDTGKLVKLQKEGRPIKFEKRLGAVLHLEDDVSKNSVTLIAYLFRGNWISIGAMSMKVARWMANTSAEVEDAILGEG
jgi:hypothetical protein